MSPRALAKVPKGLALAAVLLLGLGACSVVGSESSGTDAPGSGSGSAEPVEQEAPTREGDAAGAGAASVAPEGSADPAAAEPPEFVALWVGLYCSASDEPMRRFSFYVDGRPVQQIETSCHGDPEPGVEPPNGGQFRVPVTRGVHVLRMQDDTSDYYSEHDIAVPGDHWVFLHHRTLPGGSGHLTSILPRYERPRFAY